MDSLADRHHWNPCQTGGRDDPGLSMAASALGPAHAAGILVSHFEGPRVTCSRAGRRYLLLLQAIMTAIAVESYLREHASITSMTA